MKFLRIWLLVTAAALFVHLGSAPLFDADEGRNAEVGREMAATNDYVMPRIDGMPYLDKPIVYFAAEAAAMEVLGPTELAARLPACVFTLLTAFLVFRFARGTWGEEEALASTIAFLAMPLTLASSTPHNRRANQKMTAAVASVNRYAGNLAASSVGPRISMAAASAAK